jgi:hypothetical protein
MSSKAPKKQNIQVSRPIIRLVSKTASTRREPSIPPTRTSPNILGSDDIERDIDEGEDDNDIEEDNIEEEEEQLTFTSTWRATVGKEPLPGARTRIYKDGEITMNDLFSWEIEVMGQSSPRRFEASASKFEAIASYERARASDECPQYIQGDSDLAEVMNILQAWHQKWPKKSLSVRIILYLTEKKEEVSSQPVTQQGRRTATQQQLAALPNILSTEQAAGNTMPAIADKWSCSNRSCRNYGFTYWQDRFPDAPDLATNHYPIPGELMRLWSKEIQDQYSTAAQPSNHIVVKLVSYKLREKKQAEKGVPSQQGQGGSSTTDQLLQALILQQIGNRTSGQIQQNHLTSSPLRTSKDPIQVLNEFFTWLRSRPSWKSEQQTELLESIENKVIEDGWDIDRLRRIRKQDWQDYGFGIGTLERIRDEISSFKRLRPCSSSSSN